MKLLTAQLLVTTVVIVEDVPRPQPPKLDAFILEAPKKCPEPPLSQPKEWWRGGRPR